MTPLPPSSQSSSYTPDVEAELKAERERHIADLVRIGDAMAFAVRDRWTGGGQCDCACCASAREWLELRYG